MVQVNEQVERVRDEILAGLSKSDLEELARLSPAIRFAQYCQILGKDNAPQQPIPWGLQLRMDEVYTAHREANDGQGEACFMVVLKPRQSGGSTFAGNIVAGHLRQYPSETFFMADIRERTNSMWMIFNRFLVGDPAFQLTPDACPYLHRDPSTGLWQPVKYERNTTDPNPAAGTLGVFSNGSRVMVGTGEDPNAGISRTRQCVWISELGRFHKTGVLADREVVKALMGGFNKTGRTSLWIQESTAKGPSGLFYEDWQRGITLDEWRAGKRSGFVKVFCGWHEVPDYSLDLAPPSREHLIDSLKMDSDWHRENPELWERENEGMQSLGWALEQVAWRRQTIEREYSGDQRAFDQDYPSRPHEAFQASGGKPMFDSAGLSYVRDIVTGSSNGVEHCHIRIERERTRPAPEIQRGSPSDSDFLIYERPVIGRRYILGLDFKTGFTPDGAERNRDRHSAILSKGPLRDRGSPLEEKAAVVARIKGPCYLDDDIFADRVEELALLYGNCKIIPESNAGQVVIPILLEKGLTIYHRQVRNPKTGKIVSHPGYWMGPRERRDIDAEMKRIIRSQLWDIPDPELAEQLHKYVQTEKGTGAAMEGEHDDDVIAWGLGLLGLDGATTYRDPWASRGAVLPADYRDWKPIKPHEM